MIVEIPDRVELCVADRKGLPCPGVIHRRGPEATPYSYRCDSERSGTVFARVDDSA